jgi:uncharacterized membrane protein
MKKRSFGCVLLAAVLLGAGQAPASAAAVTAACTWQATALSLPPGGSGAVTATDGQGGAAGSVSLHAVAWKGGQYTDYGTPGTSTGSTTAAENRAGTLVGTAHFSNPFTGITRQQAFTSGGGTLTALPLPAGYDQSSAVAIGDSGDITGTVWKTGPRTVFTTVRWPAAQPGTVTVLPGVPQDGIGPEAVDEDGSILVVSADADRSLAVWRNGAVTPLGTLPGLKYLSGSDLVNGRAAGFGVYNGKNVGVYWDRQGAAHVLPGSSYNLSNGNPQFHLDSAGLVVGRVDSAHGGDDLAGTGYGVWDQGSWVSPFGDVRADIPAAIGDDGTVGGFRTDGTGKQHPYTWRCA